jgi:hypothetical protein
MTHITANLAIEYSQYESPVARLMRYIIIKHSLEKENSNRRHSINCPKTALSVQSF